MTDSATLFKCDIEALLEANRNVVFSTTWCGHCTTVKRILKDNDIRAHIVELDEANNMCFSKQLFDKTSHRTIPQVFVQQEFIGGADDLKRGFAEGDLKQRMKY